MTRVCFFLVLAVFGCDEAPTEAPVQARAQSPETRSPEPQLPEPQCSSDDECVVVSTENHTSAEHVSRAEAVRIEYERDTGHRVPVDWAAPVELHAFCEDRTCRLDRIEWPELRRCETGDTCEYVAEPCTIQVSVLASRAQEARELVATDEREAGCAPLRESLEELHEAFGGSAEQPVCRRGFCR